eukprot:12835830-Alexandrium_andersonii.AAC.1
MSRRNVVSNFTQLQLSGAITIPISLSMRAQASALRTTFAATGRRDGLQASRSIVRELSARRIPPGRREGCWQWASTNQ